jgi:excisionase family DNA binding protein
MTDRTLTIRDLCERYGVNEHTVLSWIRAGELRALNVGRRPGSKKPRWRVTPEALTSFEPLRTNNPPPPGTRRRRRQPELIEFY